MFRLCNGQLRFKPDNINDIGSSVSRLGQAGRENEGKEMHTTSAIIVTVVKIIVVVVEAAVCRSEAAEPHAHSEAHAKAHTQTRPDTVPPDWIQPVREPAHQGESRHEQCPT